MLALPTFTSLQEYRALVGDVAFWRPYLQALGLALHRQAVGLAQHHTIDVFMLIAERFPVHAITTLDDLATILFA